MFMRRSRYSFRRPQCGLTRSFGAGKRTHCTKDEGAREARRSTSERKFSDSLSLSLSLSSVDVSRNRGAARSFSPFARRKESWGLSLFLFVLSSLCWHPLLGSFLIRVPKWERRGPNGGSLTSSSSSLVLVPRDTNPDLARREECRFHGHEKLNVSRKRERGRKEEPKKDGAHSKLGLGGPPRLSSELCTRSADEKEPFLPVKILGRFSRKRRKSRNLFFRPSGFDARCLLRPRKGCFFTQPFFAIQKVYLLPTK